MRERLRRQASMLLVVMLVTMVLLMLVLVVGSNTLVNMRATSSVTDKREARYAAYAGLQRAMVELQKTPTWTTGFSEVAMPGKSSLCYSVEVKNNINGALNQAGVPEEEQVPLNAVRLEAVAGDKTDPTKPMLAVTGLSGLAVPLGGMFQQAALADSSVSLDQGARTEAFDFTAWTEEDRKNDTKETAKGYIDETTNLSQAPERGKVHANRRMTVSGGSKVEGDVTLPKQNEDGTGLQQGRDYTGTEKILTTPTRMPGFSAPIDPATATAALSNFPPTVIDDDGKGDGDKDGDDGQTVTPASLAAGAYKSVDVPAGQQLTLSTGTYYFKERFQVEGEILIDASGGPVIVHVGEKMIVGGSGMLNMKGRPRELQVYFTDELENPDYEEDERPQPSPSGSPGSISLETTEAKKISILEMRAGSRAVMVAAGKHTKASIGSGARLMGALVADYMNLVGGKIQYDIDLKSGNFFANCPWDLQGVHEKKVR